MREKARKVFLLFALFRAFRGQTFSLGRLFYFAVPFASGD
jgi:hypothetical protein